MTQDGDQMLRQMFEALPVDQRVSFLEKIIDTLPDEQKRDLHQQIRDQIIDPSPAGINSHFDALDLPKNLDALAKPPGNLLPEPKSEEKPEEALAQEIEKFAAVSQNSFAHDQRRLKKEMVGCMAVFGLVVIFVIVLAVLGREAWEFLLSLF